MTAAQMEVRLTSPQRATLATLADRGVWHSIDSNWGQGGRTEQTMAALEKRGLVSLNPLSGCWRVTHLGYVWLMHQVVSDLAWVDPFSKVTQALFSRLAQLAYMATQSLLVNGPVNWKGDEVTAP